MVLYYSRFEQFTLAWGSVLFVPLLIFGTWVLIVISGTSKASLYKVCLCTKIGVLKNASKLDPLFCSMQQGKMYLFIGVAMALVQGLLPTFMYCVCTPLYRMKYMCLFYIAIRQVPMCADCHQVQRKRLQSWYICVNINWLCCLFTV